MSRGPLTTILAEVRHRYRRLDLDAPGDWIEREPPSHVLGWEQRGPVEFVPRSNRVREQKGEVPLVLPRAVADPRPAGDARPGSIEQVLFGDEAVAPQILEMPVRHAREL